MTTTTPSRGRRLVPVALFGLLAAAEPLGAIVKEGSPAPAWDARDLWGKRQRSADFPGEVVALVFGELYHGNTVEAIRGFQKLMKRPPQRGLKVRIMLVSGSGEEPGAIEARLEKAGFDAGLFVLLDSRQAIYEAYDVKVIPSVVVVDRGGVVALSVSGYPFNFEELVADGVLFASGVIEKKQSELLSRPRQDERRSDEEIEAMRNVRIARGFARRKLHDLARQRFQEALRLVPDLIDAKWGLAEIEMRSGEIQPAEKLYREILEKSPDHVEATLGLVRIELRRDHVSRAKERVLRQIALYPLDPRSHFLLGQIYEQEEDRGHALAAYKKAASLLLAERESPWRETREEPDERR